MAEQNESTNRQNTDPIRTQRQPNGPSGLRPGQRSQPPQRGLLKRVREQKTSRPTGGVNPPPRQPITHDQPTAGARPPSAVRPQRVAVVRTGRPTAGKSARPNGFVDPGAERMRLEQALALKRQAEEERRRLEEEAKNKLTAEQEERLKAEAEHRHQQQELARQRAEEERIRRQKEAEQRKAAAEQKRLEREAELKRQEEERIRLEKEAELKRIEAEKIHQENERQRIFQTIESCRGKLEGREVELAKQIAAEMVARNIHWHGYISLSSGIGGAMLR
jgi:hypothetical protein